MDFLYILVFASKQLSREGIAHLCPPNERIDQRKDSLL